MNRAEAIAKWKSKKAGIAEEPEPKEEPLDPVVDAIEQLAELPSAFAQRAKQEESRLRDATDSEYWVAVVFQTRAEKEEFLAKSNLDSDGRIVDGADLAKTMGIELTQRVPQWKPAPIKKKLVDLT